MKDVMKTFGILLLIFAVAFVTTKLIDHYSGLSPDDALEILQKVTLQQRAEGQIFFRSDMEHLVAKAIESSFIKGYKMGIIGDTTDVVSF